MAAQNPTQRELLSDMLVELVAMNVALAAVQLDVAANTAAIAGQQAVLKAVKDFQHFHLEYLIDSDPVLADIDSGTHTFPTV
jgi:hypothetical protein